MNTCEPSDGPAVACLGSHAGRDEAPASRFTRDGCESLENHLARVCDQVRSGVRGLIPERKLVAVLLGGGYGRGEGGVFRGPEGERPYNDLEFYVVMRGSRHINELLYGHALEAMAHILTHLAGVEVEFRVASPRELAPRPPSMFSCDLLQGHRLLHGRPALPPRGDEARLAVAIPLEEATRLLMNRSTGLLLSRSRLSRDPLSREAADFILRNVAKARLACGDAVLAALGLHDGSCLERHGRLRRLAESEPSEWLERLLAAHAAGVAFKLHPDTGYPPRGELGESLSAATGLSRACWLWLESRRLGPFFESARAYAEDPRDTCPGTSRLRNLVLNLRVSGGRALRDSRSLRHPRERVFRALALLLWDDTPVDDASKRARLQRELDTDQTSFEGLVCAYERLWMRVR